MLLHRLGAALYRPEGAYGRNRSTGGGAIAVERGSAPADGESVAQGAGAEIRPALRAAFEGLDRAGIAWCLLRGEDRLAEPVDDVDVLVAPADGTRVGPALRPLGWAAWPAWGRGSHRFYIAYDATEDRWLKLDVVTELSFGPAQALRTRAAEACLERRRPRGPLTLLSVEDAFWALLLHCLLDRATVRPGAAARLRQLAEAAVGEGPLARWIAAALPPGIELVTVVEHVRAADWPTLRALGRRIRARWTRGHPLEVGRRTAAALVLRRLTRLLVPLRRRGLTVALLGPDGAGKSSLAAGLEATFFVPVRRFYLGLYPTAAPGGPAPRRGLARRILRLWRAYLAASYQRARGRLVVYDRYTYDALLPVPRPLGRLARLRRWLLAHALPAPDATILLDAPAEMLHRRSGEQDVARLERQRRAYLGLRGVVPRLEVVDASRSGDEVRRTVTTVVWRRFAARLAR